MSEKEDADKFYHLKVLPHPDKDGVDGTKLKAVELQKALERFGLTVYLQFEYRMGCD